MTKNYYHDIKEGDILKLGRLELRVLLLNDNGNLLVRYGHASTFIRANSYQMRNGFGIYNFGRKHGSRCHIRLEVPEGQRYSIERQRKPREVVEEIE